jgi:hypothetical protein
MKKNNIEVLETLPKEDTKKFPLCKCKCHCGNIFKTRYPKDVESCGCNRSKHNVGKRFNKLIIIKKVGNNISGSIIWGCLCDCGNIVQRTSSNLNNKSNCGCVRLSIRNLIGKRFGKLIVIKKTNKRKNGYFLWECKCDCGQIIERISSELKKGRQDCGNHIRNGAKDYSGQKFNKITVISPSNETCRGETIWNCVCECGTKLKSLVYRLTHNYKYSCGCSNRVKRGKNHHCYNKNLTDEQRLYRKYNPGSFRTPVFERDNYTCIVCDEQKMKLNTHHLNNYHWCEEGRLDPKNGVTLCEKCHKEFHKKYGRINNNLFQFIEFMENWYDSSIEI